MSVLPTGPALVTVLTAILMFGLAFQVGRARIKHRVMPPQMTGPPEFERTLRVQGNTLESSVPFLAVLWVFALTVSQVWATVLGLVWIAARVAYAVGYIRSASGRLPGFMISTLIFLALTLGSLVGLLLDLTRSPSAP